MDDEMTCSKYKLREILFDLSVQMQIEGYEKHDPKRPTVQKGY